MDVYSLIDKEQYKKALSLIEYLSSNELEKLFNHLTAVCPDDILMKAVEEEINKRIISITPEEYNPGEEYQFFE